MSDRAVRLISKEEFESMIALNKARMVIQKIGISYGSLLYFTMDTAMYDRDDMLELTLWGDLWWLFKNEKRVCESETITREFAEGQLSKLMEGARFENITLEENAATLVFSNGFSIVVERDLLSDYDDLLTLSLSDAENSIIILANETPLQFKVEYNAEI